MKISQKEARAAKRRWENVNKAEHQELRKTPLSAKIISLAALMSSVKGMGWKKALSEEEREVRLRWQRLRKVYHAQRDAGAFR